ncbi:MULTISPECIES: response regulator [unclassified Paenibacillus]|uniref:response regulator n=1 Tax=unclassified Paenibacillus TaxID=185978 RepID=UPI002406153A|nr:MULTISPECIES: response regulator [unclassified Paenibacillus]MDF9839518.1 two-component system response regulator YesN [Paenibacillus sp. PastF-2]MDF9846099.1 two-component system response regulator YesN [Paenibacillus sp. PastM-2]MDF9852672.1 two-component system response regulator YesN [Paenibacillus sp. PastF-1]MDH6477597.1 two-component system response regulator YesN [Paenibacillus sp. PastH-2]MDH6505340.1 two-component system response regulator YesN [Paenibacillus sp. PastM-3]
MFNLLIVDDEQSVVDSLTLTIPWESYGVAEIYGASSGAEALELLSQQTIDIVITDIRMPEMSGIELLERIKQLSSKMKCIVLSGHDDFVYAQKALEYRAVSYLLKPVDVEQIIEEVVKAVNELKEEWTALSSLENLKYTLNTSLPVLREHLLNDILNNKPLKQEVLNEKLQLFELPFFAGDLVNLALVRMEEGFSNYDVQSLSLLEHALASIAIEVFQNNFWVWHCFSDHGYLVLLLKSKSRLSDSLLHSVASKFQQHTQTFLNEDISIYLSPAERFPEQISSLYQQSLSVFTRYAGSQNGLLLSYNASMVDNIPLKIMSLYEPPYLFVLLEAGRWIEFGQKLESIFAEMKLMDDLTSDVVYEVFIVLAAAFIHAANKNGRNYDHTVFEIEQLQRRPGFLSANKLEEWSYRQLNDLRENLATNMENKQQGLVTRVQLYIQENLSEGISLQSIADYVCLHPVHLSSVYKSVTGETIGDYLLKIRMERAVFLLKNTDLKVFDISGKLGYTSVPHFIKVFKKQIGFSPQEFRENSN